MNKDTIVGVVGAVILVIAMIGVFKYEGDQAGSATGGRNAFDVAWSTTDKAGPSADGSVNLKGSADGALKVAEANVTKATFALTWTATNGKDKLKLTVTSPSGEAKTAESDTGTVNVAFDVAPLPPATTARGDDANAAKKGLAPQAGANAAVGEWKLKVEFLDATGIQLHPAQPPIQQDQKVSWKVSSLLTVWEPKVGA
ncbi:MAG TPA: hypothetical protein VM889_13875 [Candidatus Thermoplasmatota archaeon]|nr:hypothetical protein [Candidatus Thermoplasmatota archaeon]